MARGYTSDRFVSRGGRTLAVAVTLAAVLVAIGMTPVARDWRGVAITWGAAAWVGLLAYVLFWRPNLRVDDAAVTVVNPFRTVRIPWATLIHLDTHYALTLFTLFGKFRAQCAPQPGMVTSMRAEMAARKQRPHGDLPAERRTADLPGTDSGDAAALVRDRWKRYQRTTGDAAPAPDQHRPDISLHTGALAAAIAPGLVIAVLLLPIY